MSEYEFTIVAAQNGVEEDMIPHRFGESCSDALISIKRGFLFFEFIREAVSASTAIESAVNDVLSGGAIVRRIEPDDLVTISDIAERSGLTRSAISLYAKGERSEGFPRPVVRISSDSPLYSWCAVAAWLLQQRGKATEIDIELAIAISQKNKLLGRDGEICYTKKPQQMQSTIAMSSERKREWNRAHIVDQPLVRMNINQAWQDWFMLLNEEDERKHRVVVG